jgi:hypothetical protein
MKNAVDGLLLLHSSSSNSNTLTKEALLEEQLSLDPDRHALMYGRVVNKLARWNLCFDDVSSEANYAAGRGQVVAYNDVPILKALKEQLESFIGAKAMDLKVEGNYYYDVNKCGIGYHGEK